MNQGVLNNMPHLPILQGQTMNSPQVPNNMPNQVDNGIFNSPVAQPNSMQQFNPQMNPQLASFQAQQQAKQQQDQQAHQMIQQTMIKYLSTDEGQKLIKDVSGEFPVFSGLLMNPQDQQESQDQQSNSRSTTPIIGSYD